MKKWHRCLGIGNPVGCSSTHPPSSSSSHSLGPLSRPPLPQQGRMSPRVAPSCPHLGTETSPRVTTLSAPQPPPSALFPGLADFVQHENEPLCGGERAEPLKSRSRQGNHGHSCWRHSRPTMPVDASSPCFPAAGAPEGPAAPVHKAVPALPSLGSPAVLLTLFPFTRLSVSPFVSPSPIPFESQVRSK